MLLVLASALLVSLPAASSPAAPFVTVELSNFKFAPANVELRSGVPLILHLSNTSSSGHSFSAPAFFAKAKLSPQSAGLVRKGVVEVPARSSVDVDLVAAEGEFPLKCTHTFHPTFGMRGKITVR